jgi:hypothetical protein
VEAGSTHKSSKTCRITELLKKLQICLTTAESWHSFVPGTAFALFFHPENKYFQYAVNEINDANFIPL